jgi:RNA polymerase sigma-70 factor, ECF subfamily
MAATNSTDSGHANAEVSALVEAAVAGDRVALERLLLSHYDELACYIKARLPARLQATQSVEDILQITFCQAFRDIAGFQPREGATFGAWLATIASNRLLDAIKQHDGPKRGGDWQRISENVRDESRVLSLLDWIAADEPSPSSIVARDEALQALHVALASVPPDERDAIRLRLLEGKSLEETAAVLGRTPDAIRGLVHRGKEHLQATMGRASNWLKR